MAQLKTVTVSDVEILKVGTFVGQSGGRQTYTIEDLTEFAAAHAALVEGGHFPTVYLGHTSPDLPEPPAVGRIVALAVKGDRLLADLADVPSVVAKLMAAKAYGTRSIEGLRLSWGRALEIGGKKYRQVLTGLALLGKSLPAVDGLADVEALYAAGPAPADWTEVDLVQLAAKDPVAEALAALDSWAELALELIKGKTYAPAIRQRVRMLKDDFRRIAGGTTTVEASMQTTEDEAATAIALAGPSEMTAQAAMSYLAGKLGLPDGDYAAVVAAVAELTGGTQTAEEPAPEEAMMSDGNVKNSMGGDSALVLRLQAEQGDLLKRLATIEGERARDAAAAAVEGAIQAGKAVPAQRETLMRMALGDMTTFQDFIGSAPVVVQLGERGTSRGADAAAYEPSAEELKAAMKMGLSRDAAAALLRDHKKAE